MASSHHGGELVEEPHLSHPLFGLQPLASCAANPAAAAKMPGILYSAADHAVIKPSLLVLDQIMPGLRGTDVLRAVRATPGVSDVPATFYSAGGEEEEEEARRLGALAWLTKGRTSWEELRDKVLAAYKPGSAST